MSWEEKKIVAVVDAAIEASRRSRRIFGAINIVGFVFITAQFNAYLPWIRELANIGGATDVRKLLQSPLHQVSIQFLGVAFDVWDLQTMGSLCLLILVVWLFYCARREKHAVRKILELAVQKPDRDLMTYMYYSVAQNSVFTTVTEVDLPPMATLAYRVLLYIPAWVPVVFLAADGLSLHYAHILSTWPDVVPKLPGQMIPEVLIRSFSCGAMGYASELFCLQIRSYDESTRKGMNFLRDAAEKKESKAVEKLTTHLWTSAEEIKRNVFDRIADFLLKLERC